MSRAFVKEADAKEPRCPQPPGCGGAGIGVTRATVETNVAPGAAPEFHGDVLYCPDPDCAVAYFDAFGTRILLEATLRRAWPKDADAPVCSCFGVDVEAIEDCATSGAKATMKEWIARSHTAEARCATTAPDGRNCEEKMRRIFLRALGVGD